MSADLASRPHSVYRVYGVRGDLLYIGCSADPEKRMRQHMVNGESKWRWLAERVTVELFPDRASALAAESVAIREEEPIWNLNGSGRAAAAWSDLTWEPHAPRHSGRHVKDVAA